jgi:hypothetical protein
VAVYQRSPDLAFRAEFGRVLDVDRRCLLAVRSDSPSRAETGPHWVRDGRSLSAWRSLETALNPVTATERPSGRIALAADERGRLPMDPAQLATEACKRFAALHSSATPSSALQGSAVQGSAVQGSAVQGSAVQGSTSAGSAIGGSAAEPLLDAFKHLGTLDGWAKIAMTRLAADPQDARAHTELRRSLEQAARLHPQFTRRLADVLADRPAVKTSLSNTGSLPLQHLS